MQKGEAFVLQGFAVAFADASEEKYKGFVAVAVVQPAGVVDGEEKFQQAVFALNAGHVNVLFVHAAIGVDVGKEGFQFGIAAKIVHQHAGAGKQQGEEQDGFFMCHARASRLCSWTVRTSTSTASIGVCCEMP